MKWTLELVVVQDDAVIGVGDGDAERQLRDHGLQLGERVLCPPVEVDQVERERDSPRELRHELEVFAAGELGLHLVDGDLADARLHVVHELEETRAVIHRR